jgi:transposase-like protein
MELKIINCPHCGKIISLSKLRRNESKRKVVNCPECASQNNWKDGFRKIRDGDIQRYICRDCGYRFSYL